MFHKKLVLLSFGSRLRAGQAHLAMQHLAEQGRLVIHDAVMITRNDNTPAFVEEIVDDACVQMRGSLGVDFWSAFFGAALQCRSGHDRACHELGALLDDAGLPAGCLDELKHAVGDDTSSVALLVSDVDPLAVVVELERFNDGRMVITNLPGKSVDVFRKALLAEAPAQLSQGAV